MFKWLHHLFNPHCELCFSEKQYTIEKLSLLLEQERAEKFRLLELLAPNREYNVQTKENAVDITQLRRNPRTIMRELENNSARAAEQIRRRTTEEHIADVEKDLEATING